MELENLTYAVRDGVARITLDRPDAANALDLALSRELMHAAIAADEDPAVRAVLIAANGRMFCAGGDLGSFRHAGEGVPALLKEMTTYLHAAISRFARMRAPVVGAVGGAAAGAGLSLLCALDYVVASEEAKFTLAYTQVGLAPDGSSTYWLPRLLGAAAPGQQFLFQFFHVSAQRVVFFGGVCRHLNRPVQKLEQHGKRVAIQTGAMEHYIHPWSSELFPGNQFQVANTAVVGPHRAHAQ